MTGSIDSFDCEDIWIEVQISTFRSEKNSSCYIGVIYRHPTNHIDAFMEKFGVTLFKLTPSKKRFHVMGDFGVNLLKQHTNHTIGSHYNLLNGYNCLCSVDKPAGVTAEFASLLDHFYWNDIDVEAKTYIITCNISDNFGLLTSIKSVKLLSNNTLLLLLLVLLKGGGARERTY